VAEACDIEIAYTRNAGWCWRCHVHDVNGFNLPGKADAGVAATAHQRAWRETNHG